YPSSRSKLATSTTKTRIFAATFSALTPGTSTGTNASASTSSTSSTASTRLRGKSLERMRLNMSGPSFAERVDTLRAPQQDGGHEGDVREQRGLGHEEAGVVGHQADQQRADERAAGRAQPSDDQHDEDEHVDLRAHLGD